MSSDPYTPSITRTLNSTGRDVEFTAAELDELIERMYDLTAEARKQQLHARLNYVTPQEHDLTMAPISGPLGETVTFFAGDGVGTWPYGSPMLVFEAPSKPTFSPLTKPSRDDEEHWRLTLSGATGLTFGTAHWQDTDRIYALFRRAATTTAENLATQAVLEHDEIRWSSIPLDGVVDAIDTILEATHDLPPVDVDTAQQKMQALDPDIILHHLRLLDPRIMRFVSVPQIVHANQPWSHLASHMDALLKKTSLAPIRRSGNSSKHAFLFEHRLATARPQPKTLRSVPATLTPFLSPQPTSDDDPLDAGWFTAAARPINTAPLTHTEHAQMLQDAATR